MTTTHENLPPRQKSQRVVNKTEKYVQYEQMKQQQQHHNHTHNQNHHGTHNTSNGSGGVAIHNQRNHIHHHHHHHHQKHDVNPGDANDYTSYGIQRNVYPGLNDIADAFELFPQELVRYFTLLKEIDAKCVYTVPYLKLYIKRFLEMDGGHPKKQLLLLKIRNLIKELMPSLEEKMHVASILVDTVVKHISRIEDDYNEILDSEEIPVSVRVGPLNHPAMIMETKIESQSKSAQSQRSESRREALAAKKLLNINAPTSHLEDELDSSGTATALPLTTTTTTKKKRQMTGATHSTQSQQSSSLQLTNSRKRKQVDDTSRPSTPLVTAIVLVSTTLPSVQQVKSKKQNKPIGQSGSHKDDNFQEPVYCYCQQVSFGEMVGCDGDDCKREWFHLPCIGLTDPPKGKWYCNDCLAKQKRAKR